MDSPLPPTLLTLLAAVPSAGPAAAHGQDAAPPARPNILFVFADDHAAQAISAYGSRLCQTPNIDRLAREGMLFANAFCGDSICAPSRATILTGLHSHANGVLDNGTVFDGSQTTFPKLLQAAGYQTAIVGKWHLKSDPTGFDHWQVLRGQGPYYNPPIKSAQGTTTHEGYTTEVLTDLALAWLRDGRDAQRPFLLMYQHKAPHRNWQPGPRELGMYDDTVFPEPATLFDDWSGRTTACAEQEMTIAEHMTLPSDLKLTPPGNLTPAQLAAWNAVYEPKREAFEAAGLEGRDLVRWKYQRYMQDYLACIAAIDRQLGRVLDYLDASGLAENTVVVYSSDQGFYLGEHGWYDKRWMYEESLRMPLIVRWPGVAGAGSRCERLVQNIDFAPTFLAMAGVEAPESMHGESFVPLLRGEDPPGWRRSIYYHYYEYPAVHMVARHYGVRTERHKLIHYYQRGEWELFDLQRDPHELRSVHAEPEYAELRGELTQELRRLQMRYGESEPETTPERVVQGAARRKASAVEPAQVFHLPDLSAPLPDSVDPAAKPLTVAATCRMGGDGVLLAQGGESYGWALHLAGGRPTFSVRNRERLFQVSGPVLADGAVAHLAATLDPQGVLGLWIDGQRVAQAPGQVIERRPSDGLSAGADTGSHVGDYADDGHLPGRAWDLRLHWGALGEATLAAWSKATKR